MTGCQDDALPARPSGIVVSPDRRMGLEVAAELLRTSLFQRCDRGLSGCRELET